MWQKNSRWGQISLAGMVDFPPWLAINGAVMQDGR